MTTEPNNEMEVCDAVMRAIKTEFGEPLEITARPDTTERQLPAVELLFESKSKRYQLNALR